jgi:PAS domain S-box-containing protein
VPGHDSPVRTRELTADIYRLLIESVQDYAIFVLDPRGCVVTWNTGAERIKGYSASDIVGQHFSAFYTEEDRAARKPELELEIAAQAGRVEDEGWRLRKDGSRFWANIVITALRDATGQLTGFGKVTRDLTARREAEETERQLIALTTAREVAEATEARYRTLSQRLEVILEGVGDGITAQDRQGRLLFANSAAAHVCGFESVPELLAAEPDEVMRRFEILDETGVPLDAEQLPGGRALRTGQAQHALVRVRNVITGSDLWTSVHASAVLGESGQPDLAVNIWHDVSDDHRREQRERYLAAATSALSSSLDYNDMLSKLASLLVPGLADWCAINLIEGDRLENVAIAHVDRSKIATAREYQRKYALDARTGRGSWTVLEDGHSELYETISDDALVKRALDPEHLRYLRALEMRSLIIAPILVRDRPVGTLSLISTRAGRRYDKSDLALVEELGRRAGASIENARLYAAEKSAARRAEEAAKRAEDAGRIKDEFLATVSHELRTPLNAIVGWAHILRERNHDEALAKGIDVIHRNAQAQAKIIEDILDVSRIITGNLRLDLKPADLLATIRNAIEVVGASANAKQIAIDFTPPVESCVVTADHERLQQVVWNLLSNAVKFTEKGGRISVSVRCSSVFVSLAVSDTGSGIDAQFLPYVFDRFKQADSSTTRRVGGLGLGLAIVRHIVELHGGRVVVDSAGLGRGATFTVTLPVSAQHAAAQTRALAPPAIADPQVNVSSSSLQGVRVLIVDDEADTRELLLTVLTNAGAAVDCAASAASAFDALQRFHPHVLVSDVGMPDEDGYAFMQRVRTLPPNRSGMVPSIALTAYTRSTDRSKALSAGFSAHLAKPVNVADLVGTVAKLAMR